MQERLLIKHSLNLYEGQIDRLKALSRTGNASVMLRMIIDAYLKTVETGGDFEEALSAIKFEDL